ncbi:putative protein (Fragment) OS=Streptomyces microflavus OX=1919 GN=G3I39_22015 PE=4 SV=1 [Streptomyces microflavus]
MVLAQARLIPGVLTGSARYDQQSRPPDVTRASPTTRGADVAHGKPDAGEGGKRVRARRLRLNVDVGHQALAGRGGKLARCAEDGPEAKPAKSAGDVPIEARLELHKGDRRLAMAGSGRTSLLDAGS